MSKIDEGEVALQLLNRDGHLETVYLKPTIGATRKISRHFGDIQSAFQKVLARNFDAICFIVFEGLQVSDDKKAAGRIEERIFRTGIVDVSPKVIEYIGVLQNGGRPLKADDQEDEEEGQEGASGNGS
ncbi:MAG: hypothetical protein ACMVO3_22675 [Thalassobaculum sp.]